ncbi:MAG TPA: alpha-L-arabinofuranosidase C-terminal domain-containing protein [Aridibacter sp.]|nr:alpha-L-arabinofuranosidase C-terminal domain-containing protein [Aridibacter sp.]
MKSLNRREFLGTSLLASSALAFGLPQSARAADSSIEILVNEPVGTIAPEIYGHFVEHLGAVVYDGIWVGQDSKIPNINGIRRSLVDALKKVKPGVIRYPGGCFADSYNWRDGVGDRAKRPKRTNFWYGVAPKEVPLDSTSRIEPNWFGTNEFIGLCSLVGAKPYLAANLRGLPAHDFWEWVEYCNSPAETTTLAKLRAQGSAGSREPFGVEYWGIGNESWGCGGNLLPDEYSQEYRRFTAAVPGYNVPLKFIGAGASSDDLEWTRGFFSRMAEKRYGNWDTIHGWGVHHYSWNVSGGRTSDWSDGKGDAVDFNTEQYYELIAAAAGLEDLLNTHWGIMGEFDKEHRVKIAVDEWGSWHRPGTELKPEHLLGQQNTMRDALVASISLDIFNRHADKVFMANIAQLVNCLQALFLADGEKFVTTPTYHVFDMFAPHQGASALRTEFRSPTGSYERNGKPATFNGLSGSASVKNKTLTLTVSNPHLKESREAEIKVRGANISSAEAAVLASDNVRDHNTFEEPNAVRLKTAIAHVNGGYAVFTFPPASVTRIRARLA